METRIKERLTGALILVAALVILVPEIFSGRRLNAPKREAPPAAPASEGPPLRSYTSELSASNPPPVETAGTVPEAPAPSPPVAPPPSQPTGPHAAEPVPPPPKPVVEKPPVERTASEKPARVEKPAPEPARETKPAPAAGDWFVQVGSFSQAENAERYAQQLRKQGFTAIVLPPAGAKGLSRVRVGPARSRDAAAALLERLTASGHKGAVVGS